MQNIFVTNEKELWSWGEEDASEPSQIRTVKIEKMALTNECILYKVKKTHRDSPLNASNGAHSHVDVLNSSQGLQLDSDPYNLKKGNLYCFKCQIAGIWLQNQEKNGCRLTYKV